MAGSLHSIGPNMVRIAPGKLSVARFEREAAALGCRLRVSGWRIWAQTLPPDPGHLFARVEGGVATPAPLDIG